MNYNGLFLILVLLVGCSSQVPATVETAATAAPSASPAIVVAATEPAPSPEPSPTELPPSPTPRPSATSTARPSRTAVPSATSTPVPTETALPSETALPPTETPPPPTETALPPTPVPPSPTVAVARGVVCARPPDDYSRVTVGRHTISARTAAMLDNAQALYGGRGSMRFLIQGSYAPGLGASFGTHDAGGAVDIWAVDPNDTSQLLADIPAMVMALRQSGFAAWFRPANMLYQGMYPHIHAIAVGDAELSGMAAAQLTGDHGYFRGRNGLPEAEFAGPDPHGGPVLCQWMEQLGYTISRPQSASCQAPVDDYTRVTVRGQTISRRTHTMLQAAQALYGGPGDLLYVTQGSYSAVEPGSFGTHDGGGAVDISIRHPSSGEFLYSETERMVQALRQAGFAAWYRAPGDLGPNSAPHLHAIAIGDAELSEAARAQLTGEQGYFRGRNGLPQPEYAAADRHGGPIVCGWMEALGYSDLR